MDRIATNTASNTEQYRAKRQSCFRPSSTIDPTAADVSQVGQLDEFLPQNTEENVAKNDANEAMPHETVPDAGRPRGGAKGAICPGPPAKGAPHKKRMKYAVKINSNTLTECTILLFLGPQISKFFRGRMGPP